MLNQKNDINFNRDHFNDPVEHKRVNRLIEITAAYINLFLNEGSEILDVGAADGEMAKFLKGSVKSIDTLPASDNVVKGTIFDEKPETYSAVIYNHVIEHIWEFYKEIEQAVACLKPEGLLFIECPVADSPWAYNLDAHITLFRKETFEKLAKELDLEMVEYSTHCFRDDKVEQWVVLRKKTSKE